MENDFTNAYNIDRDKVRSILTTFDMRQKMGKEIFYDGHIDKTRHVVTRCSVQWLIATAD